MEEDKKGYHNGYRKGQTTHVNVKDGVMTSRVKCYKYDNSKNMTIGEIKKQLSQLESDLKSRIESFQKDTGVNVSEIDVNQHYLSYKNGLEVKNCVKVTVTVEL